MSDTHDGGAEDVMGDSGNAEFTIWIKGREVQFILGTVGPDSKEAVLVLIESAFAAGARQAVPTTPTLVPSNAVILMPPTEDGLPCRGHGLSNRERCILMLLVEGYSNKQIARRIEIAEATVKVHVKTILRKLNMNNRTQAAIWAANNLEVILAASPLPVIEACIKANGEATD